MTLARRITGLERARPQNGVCAGCGHGSANRRVVAVLLPFPPMDEDRSRDHCHVCGRRRVFRVVADREG
jgi:hypothetical protein